MDDDPGEADLIQQYEFVWVLPRQYRLARFPDGFALEVVDFLGPGDADWRGERTVWVRGSVVEASRRRAEPVTVAIPHDQPRARHKTFERAECPGAPVAAGWAVVACAGDPGAST